MEKMQKLGLASALLAGLLLVGCGASTHGPSGSMHQTRTGVSETGYPGLPKASNDPQSPALSASTEQKYSRPEVHEPAGAGEHAAEHKAEPHSEAK